MPRFITYLIIFILLGGLIHFFKDDIHRLLVKTDITAQGMATDEEFLKFVTEGDAKSVQYYLKAGWPPHKSYRGETFLMHALYENQFEVAQILLQAGARIDTQNEKGQTPLMIAASATDFPNQSYAMVETLLGKGANREIKDSNNRTALDYAWQSGNTQVATLLESYGSIDGSQSSDYSPENYFTAQELLKEISGSKSEEKFKELVRLGKDGIQVVVEGLSDSDQKIRNMSANLLPRMGPIPNEHRDVIQERYEDPTEPLRRKMAKSLINTAQYEQERLQILELIVQDSDFNIVHDALGYLRDMGNRARPIIPTLQRLMEEKPQMRRPFQNTINKIDQ